MKKERNTLLQQILENSRESIVFFEKAVVDEPPFLLEPDYVTGPTRVMNGTGFFVEPDKVVTTIDVIAGCVEVNANLSNQFETQGIVTPHDISRRTRNKYNRPFNIQNLPQIDEDAILTIEGVAAFDPKNNLVLLKIAETGTPLPLGNSDTVQIDEPVYVLGHFGDIGAMGVVGKVESRYRNDTWLQIKVQFFSAACGGPILNTNNEVVGIAAAGTDFFVEDSSTTFTRAVSSNLIKTLLAKAGKVIPLTQWQKYSRVRAHAVETEADNKAELYDTEEAIRGYSNALKLNPDLVEIYAKRGLMKTRIGNMVGALIDLNKAVKINPQNFIAYNNLASTKGALGDEYGMLDDLNQVLQINPNYIIAHLNQGQAKYQIAEFKIDEEDIVEAQQLYQEAIDHFVKVLELNPKHSFARRRLRFAKRILKKLNTVQKRSNTHNLLNS
jgi:tetratricopeptide (TPR) repeat protein